ncbi:MAG: hypothetical protein IKK42_05995 [Oscillospiraceae bacterium]|nr:hypothetical protein [Oscillospiraceae bacterium]
MKKGKGLILLSAAVLSALLMSGCRDKEPEWEDTLPVTLSEATTPTAVCETEETTTTPEPTVVTTEKTKRTAASETTPELATTTSAAPTSPTLPTDISNVPISEYTSSTARDPSTEMKPTTNPSDATAANTGTGVVEADTSAAETVISKVHTADEILRPYSYNQLSEKQLYIYDAVIAAVERLKTDVPLSTVMDISAEEYCEVYQQIYNDEHALFYIDTKMQYAMNTSTKKIASAVIFYKYSDEKIAEMQKKIDDEVTKVLEGITADMTEYDKVKYFYDYLASAAVYDESGENCRDIYGVFVDRKAICGGYSKAFSHLCDKVGIETVTVTGDADGEAHMWNMVKIDGQWYNIDITYAVTESELGSYVRYDYFCVTDEMLADTRSVYEQIYTYPKATATDCDYYIKNGLMADSWEDAKAMLTNQIAEVTKEGSFVIQVKCSSKETYEDVIYRLFDPSQKQALRIFEDGAATAAKKYDTGSVNYSQDKTSMVVKLFLDYTE